MFGSPNVRMTYNARLRRVRVHFLVTECFKYRKPPRNLLQKIEERLLEAKGDGHIETFDIFIKRFEDFWTHIRSLRGKIDENREIKFTVAQGGRLYPEISLKSATDEDLALLTCQFSQAKMLTISFNTFVFNVMLQLKKLHIMQRPDRAQLRFFYLLLKHGYPLQNEKLRAQTRPEDYIRLSRLVQIDSRHHFASLHIFDSSLLATEESCKRLLQESLREMKGLNKDRRKMTLLNKHSLEKLYSLVHKMQALGFHMPYDLLIAYDSRYKLDASVLRQEKKLARHDQEDLPRWKMRLGALSRRPRGDYFQVDVQAAGMRAVISAVEKSALKAIKSKIDLEGLIGELQKQRITFGYEKYLEDLWLAIQEDRNLVGMTVASGKAPQSGEEPELFMFPHAESSDVRDAQNRSLYRAGERLAEVRFKDGIPGRTVEDQPVHARMPVAHVPFIAGDGIILKDDGRFYAERDGIVIQDGQTLRCEKLYVHKGSINLASGNLKFDGTVMVEGDIDAGAIVEVQGSLTVKGMIADAKVRCSGDLEVVGGINSGEQGYVHVGGNASCSYIENSHVQVRHNLSVVRSILNSSVIAGGTIAVADSSRGLIAGGSVSSWSAIRVATCGLPHGQPTECRIGSDYLMEKRLVHLSKRVQRITDFCKMIDATIATMESGKVQKPDTQIEIKLIQDRSKRAHKILEKLVGMNEQLERRMTWNLQATLVVTGILEKNVFLISAGKKVPVVDSLQAVFVPATPVNGSYLLDLDDFEGFTKNHPGTMVA